MLRGGSGGPLIRIVLVGHLSLLDSELVESLYKCHLYSSVMIMPHRNTFREREQQTLCELVTMETRMKQGC
jgi:hypothetical protein